MYNNTQQFLSLYQIQVSSIDEGSITRELSNTINRYIPSSVGKELDLRLALSTFFYLNKQEYTHSHRDFLIHLDHMFKSGHIQTCSSFVNSLLDSCDLEFIHDIINEVSGSSKRGCYGN